MKTKSISKKVLNLLYIMVLVITSINVSSIQTVHAASAVKLNATKKIIQTGKTCTLEPVRGNQSAKDLAGKWSSSNTSVATVSDKGVVKGIKKGSAIISFTTIYKDETITLTCKVKVKNKIKVTITGTEGKDENDVKIISSIIKKQIARGAKVSTDLNYLSTKDKGRALLHDGYRWDDNGRLVEIGWDALNVTGTLDVSKLTALEKLDCGNNQLTGLKINDTLKNLYCNDNRLKKLDVSKVTQLQNLYCPFNQLTALDVSKNTNLQQINCSSNQITQLNVSKNLELLNLDCGLNKLTKLDVSKNTSLITLNCFYNQLTVLDISKNPKLQTLYCGLNQLTKLNVTNNVALEELYCQGNKLLTLDVSKCPKLTTLTAGDSVKIIR